MAKTSESGTPALEELSELLRDAAQRLGLSQNQVSKLSGVSRKHVGVAFSGGNISISVLKKLIGALKIETLTFGGATLRVELPAVDPRHVELATKLIERAGQAIHEAQALLTVGRRRRTGG